MRLPHQKRNNYELEAMTTKGQSASNSINVIDWASLALILLVRSNVQRTEVKTHPLTIINADGINHPNKTAMTSHNTAIPLTPCITAEQHLMIRIVNIVCLYLRQIPQLLQSCLLGLFMT
jgi:hypothetical protein